MTFSFRSNGIWSLLVMVLVLVGLFYLARGVYIVLSWATPVLLIAAAVLDYKVFVRFARYVIRLLQESPLLGVLVVVLSVVALPLLAAMLFFQALASYQSDRIRKELERRTQGEWAEYEEVEIVETADEPEQPATPRIERPEPVKRRPDDTADYEQLFD
ncbi:MAG: hypothetical protein D6740_01915 [Alphaproteobacteria bacterium]|nr:MAG: hypothetical protein D6740_01915 [Alphaproteobacteria bacterium]